MLKNKYRVLPQSVAKMKNINTIKICNNKNFKLFLNQPDTTNGTKPIKKATKKYKI